MPRSIVHENLKKMKTLSVNITKTTEEDIVSHLQKKFEELEPFLEKRNSCQSEIAFSTNYDYSEYSDNDWRKNRVKRYCFYDLWNSQFTDDRNAEKMYELLNNYLEFLYDLNLSMRCIAWHEPYPELGELEIETLRYKENYEKIFQIYDSYRYEKAKKEYEERNVEWINNNKAKETHDSYHKDTDLTDDCKYCISRKKELIRLNEYEKQEELRLQESNRKFHEEKERKRAEELDSRHLYECECCNYQTYNGDAFDRHEESKEHIKAEKIMKLFCKTCKIQCRNDIEYNYHINTKKHKIASGEITKETEFKCDLCNYVTTTKQNLDKHNNSKYHMEKIK
jgi:hypothetical protein